MNYLTNYYKNLAEQLQARVDKLTQLLEEQEPLSDDQIYERGVHLSQTSLTPNFREGIQAHPKFHHGYQMGMRHGLKALSMKNVGPESYGKFPTPSEMAQQFMATDGRPHVGSAHY